MTAERIYRWEIALLATLVLVGVGIVQSNTVALVSALVPLTYVFLGSVMRAPPSSALEIERTLDGQRPAPGSHVRVRLRVRNVGDTVLSDVRVIDGVPDSLSVVEGSPRAALSLRPGGEETLTYSVVARHGAHEFADPYVRLRTFNGTHRRAISLPVDGVERIECFAHQLEIPTQIANHFRVGSVSNDTPGSGLDFHSLRQYRHGDQLSRINWRHYAKTGDLTTVLFRESQAATALVVVDVRDVTGVTPAPGHPDGTELTTYAASQTFEALLEAGHRVGGTCLGLDGSQVATPLKTDAAGSPWIPPGADAETNARITALLDSIREQKLADREDDAAVLTGHGKADASTDRGDDTADSSRVGQDQPAAVTDGGHRAADRIRKRITDDTQVIVVSPLTDRVPLSLVRRLRVSGQEVTLLSPDLTDGSGHGATVAGLERRARLLEVRTAGVPVVDWHPSTPFWDALQGQLEGLF